MAYTTRKMESIMKLESKPTFVAQNSQFIFEKMENVANFEVLMPDNLQKFVIFDEKSFAFTLKGMPEIHLEKKDSLPYNRLAYGATEGKIPFELTLLLHPISDKETEIQFVFEGNFNPVMALMVKVPVSKLIETMTEKLKNLPF